MVFEVFLDIGEDLTMNKDAYLSLFVEGGGVVEQ